MNVEDLVREYVQLKSKLDDARSTFKNIENEVKEKLLNLETQLLGISNDSGVSSFKTEFGTAYKVTKSYASLDDMESRVRYSIENDDFGLFTSHVNKKHVQELLEEGVPPSIMGVKYEEIQAINIRRS